MKINKFLNIILAGIVVAGTACTDDFDSINSNPNAIEDINPGYLLTKVWMDYNGSPHEEHRGNLILAGPLSGIVSSGYRTGQGFSGNTDAYNEAKMVEMYKKTLRNGPQMLHVLNNDDSEDNSAKIAIGTITMQFMFQRITDLYGDIPYHEAGQGYITGNFYPAYDSQEDIYKSMVDSLKKYRDVLLTSDAAPFAPANDIIYGGIASETDRKAAWAKLANSMIMRLGLRGVNGDASWAQTTVEEAANNQAGYITSINIGEAAVLQTSVDGGDWGGHVNAANSIRPPHCFVGEEWLRMAQQNRDPRIFYCVAPVEVVDGNLTAWTKMTDYDAFAEAARVSTDDPNEPGQPWKPVSLVPARSGGTESYSVRGQYCVYGVDGDGNRVINRVFGNFYINDTGDSDEYKQFRTMAAVNPETIGYRAAPIMIFGGDESYYILSEAAELGWNVPGDAASNLQMALGLTFDKYPQLFGSFSATPQTYMDMQSAKEGVTITYEALRDDYIAGIMAGTIDQNAIQLERWKSLMTTYTYEAFSVWNRTNVQPTSTTVPTTGIAAPGTEMMKMPVYELADLENVQLGVEITPSEYVLQPFHNGGDTEDFRPRRINYPNNERTNNTEHVEAAIQRQISEYGQGGKSDNPHFVTTYQWYSKKAD